MAQSSFTETLSALAWICGGLAVVFIVTVLAIPLLLYAAAAVGQAISSLF